MRTPFIVRVPDDALGHAPRSYEDLQRLAARYARDHLAGQTIFNNETRLSITLTPETLSAATSDGAPASLLQAIPGIPAVLAEALYVRSTPDRRPLVNIRTVDLRATRRLYLLGATAEVAGRLVRLLFTVRENFGGQCFLARVTVPDAAGRRRQDGGGVSDDETSAMADIGDADPTPDEDTLAAADIGGAGAMAAPSDPGGYLVDVAARGGQQDHLSVLEGYLRNPNVQAFLSTIAQAEGATYDTLYGGKRFDDYSTYPGYGRPHSPSGRYQINAETYDYLSGRLGLTDFSPHTQDLMAAQRLVDAGAMKPLLSGDLDGALNGASWAWASLPQGPPNKPNRYPQPYKRYDTIRSIFELNRSP